MTVGVNLVSATWRICCDLNCWSQTVLAPSNTWFKSRVVSLASSKHRFSRVHLDDLDLKKTGYDAFVSYGQSKTANVSGCLYILSSFCPNYVSPGNKSLYARTA